MTDNPKKLLRVGELAKQVGKSVRAIHLYEELGLLRPVSRSAGGFRLFDETAAERIEWILKLQAIGFSLNDIQGFIRDFESAQSGRDATDRVRAIFDAKLEEIRANIAKLRSIESELVASLGYLESCQTCTGDVSPDNCHVCNQQGHQVGSAPDLFAGLSEVVVKEFDVAARDLTRTPADSSESSN